MTEEDTRNQENAPSKGTLDVIHDEEVMLTADENHAVIPTLVINVSYEITCVYRAIKPTYS